MFGPVLTGTAVTLRPPDESDPARFVEWLSDMEVTRYLGNAMGRALFEEEEWFKTSGEAKDAIFWIIEAEGRTIGSTSIFAIDWLHAHAQTGTLIGDKTAWRKGYGSETMRMRTEYAFRELNLHKLMTSVFMENEPSRRGLEKVGYREIGIEREHFFRDGRWHDHWLAEVLRAEWEHAQRG